MSSSDRENRLPQLSTGQTCGFSEGVLGFLGTVGLRRGGVFRCLLGSGAIWPSSPAWFPPAGRVWCWDGVFMDSGCVSGRRELAVRSVNVVEARMESADDIWRGLDTIALMLFDACERPRLFSASDMVLRVEGDMVEHTEDGWEGAMVQG